MKTKIIATIGPASDNLKTLREFSKEGVNILRLNTKYVSLKEFKKLEEKIRRFKNFKIMVDIKNRKLLEDFKKEKIDYLAISFAEKESEIKKIQSGLPKRIKIISKIETRKGIENIDKLIKVSEGIMIARGDLGKNISFEKVPMVQKLITKKCNLKNKMSITATEIMPSMINYLRPSRAEVSDIANAILEGSEGLMLSEETAIGKHPVLVIKNLKKIIKETEKNQRKLR
ncbi:hypothetical protein HOD88_01190 [archaeon]|jgi:pyruvate kinase|nr:hypothetical protein [archaeon]